MEHEITTIKMTQKFDIESKKVEIEKENTFTRTKWFLLGIAIFIFLICLTTTIYFVLRLIHSKSNYPKPVSEDILESKTLKWRFPEADFDICCSTIDTKQHYLKTCNEIFNSENIECVDASKGSIILTLKSTRIDFVKSVRYVLSKINHIDGQSTEKNHKYKDGDIIEPEPQVPDLDPKPQENNKVKEDNKEEEIKKERENKKARKNNLKKKNEDNICQIVQEFISEIYKNIDEKPSQDLITETLENLYTNGIEKLKESYRKKDQDLITEILTNIYTTGIENLKDLIRKKKHDLMTKILTKIYTNGVENLKPPDEPCMLCLKELYPVSFKFSCGHELCATCAADIMNKCDATECTKCRTPLPQKISKWLQLRIKIYPIALTPEIPLQNVFPFICCAGNLTTVIKCVQMGANVNKKGLIKYFPIHLASRNGHLSVVKYLINNGANVNQVDEDGVTPLFLSSYKGYLSVVEYLIKNGANVNQAQKYGVTPLLMSSHGGYLSVVECLIKNGANIDNGVGKVNPLVSAIDRNHIEIAKFLISKNAEIETAKEFFEETEKFEILDKLCKEKNMG